MSVTHPWLDSWVAQPKKVNAITSSPTVMADKRFMVISSCVDDDRVIKVLYFLRRSAMVSRVSVGCHDTGPVTHKPRTGKG